MAPRSPCGRPQFLSVMREEYKTMLNDWQRRKLTHRFNLQDRDHNGVIELKDYMGVVDAMAALRGWAPNSAEYSNFRATYQAYWAALCRMADKNKDERVALDEFLSGFEALLSDEQNYQHYIQSVAGSLFDSMDLNHDDKISLEEFSVPQQAYGLTADQARQTFERLDVSGQGYLTREEIYARAHEFFYSDDPDAPGSWLFGVF